MAADEDRHTAELLRLQAEQRAAHLNKDPDRLVALFADDFTSLSGGRVTRPTRAESLARFRDYFARVDFAAWDDLSPPEVRVAPGGGLATVQVHKVVRLTEAGAPPGSPVSETVFAWLEVYEQRDGRWQLAVVASTNAPPVEAPPAG